MKTKQALTALDQAIALIGTQVKRNDDEFTAQEYADRLSIPSRTALAILGRQVKGGVLKCRKVLIDARLTNCYSMAD